jgi:hypothetical protein
MKLTVITDAAGEVVATVRTELEGKKDDPERIGFALEAGQKAHEIELPPKLESMSADELHLALRERRLIPGAD